MIAAPVAARSRENPTTSDSSQELAGGVPHPPRQRKAHGTIYNALTPPCGNIRHDVVPACARRARRPFSPSPPTPVHRHERVGCPDDKREANKQPEAAGPR